MGTRSLVEIHRLSTHVNTKLFETVSETHTVVPLQQ